MGFDAVGVGFVVAVEKAQSLRYALGNSHNAVSDVDFRRPVDCELAAFALHQRGTGELYAHQPRLGGIQHRVVEFYGELAGYFLHQLVQLNGFAHRRIVEERHVHRFVQMLQHVDGLFRQRVFFLLAQVKAHGKARGQITDRH